MSYGKYINCKGCGKPIYVWQEKGCITCNQCECFYLYHPKEKVWLLVAVPPHINSEVVLRSSSN